MDDRIYIVACNGWAHATAIKYPEYRLRKILPFYDSNPAQGQYYNPPDEPCVVDTWIFGEVCIRLNADQPMLRVGVVNPNIPDSSNYVANIGPDQCLLVLDSITSDIPLDVED